MRTFSIFGVLLAVVACDSQSISDRVVPQYQGKPMSLIFQKWGVPDRQIKGDGGTIYQWKVHDGSGECRLEAHGADPMAGGAQHLIGVRFAGVEPTCASWLQMLR